MNFDIPAAFAGRHAFRDKAFEAGSLSEYPAGYIVRVYACATCGSRYERAIAPAAQSITRNVERQLYRAARRCCS